MHLPALAVLPLAALVAQTAPPAAASAVHATTPAHMRPAAPRARVVVDFDAPASSAEWFATALEQRVARELSRFTRVTVLDAEDIDTRGCPGRSARCLLPIYAAGGVDVVVIGHLGDDALEYEIYETWRGTRAAQGALDVGARASAARLEPQIARILRAVVGAEGIVDEMPAPEPQAGDGPSPGPAGDSAGERSTPVAGLTASGAGAGAPGAGGDAASADSPGGVAALRDTPPAAMPWSRGAPVEAVRAFVARAREGAVALLRRAPKTQLVLGTLLVFFAAPLVASRRVIRRARRTSRPRSVRWSAWASVTLAVALAISSVPHLDELAARLAVPTPTLPFVPLEALRSLLPLAGGAAWGWLALVVARLVFPKLHGIEGIRHDALWAVLGAWILVVAQRALLALTVVPFVFAPALVAAAAGFPHDLAWVLIAPATGLLGYYGLLSLVDIGAVHLDAELVAGDAGADSSWHRTIKKYFVGYVQRTGVDLDDKLLDRTLFLPGKIDGIRTYGGGFTRPRIVIGPELRELALGELPQESEAPERVVDLEALPLGLVLPAADGDTRASRRRAERARKWRRRHAATAGYVRRGTPKLIGESTTLLGWVLPSATNETVPLVANSDEDLGVVYELLTEHYAAFEKNLYEVEHDDTDPTQRDFLFGAILRELGVVMRGESLAATLAQCAAGWAEGAPRPLGALVRGTRALHARLGQRYPATIADAFTALNSGRDHLIQFLEYARTGRTDQLTARAQVPLLYRTSKEILDAVGREEPAGEDRQLFRATPRNRLVWLSRFSYAPVPEKRERRLKLLIAAGAVAGLAALGDAAVERAIAYHPTYLERMRELEQQLAESPEEGHRDGRID